jgi:hypothetical protein
MITSTDRVLWPIGLRVSRKDTNQLGGVVENVGQMKVQWDDGKTSSYRHAEEANVQLAQVGGLKTP